MPIALSIAFSAALSGCGKRITDANLREVKAEMTSKEVESILGQPTRMDMPHELKLQEVKTLQVTRYYYDQAGKTVQLTFVGDRLATGGVTGKFGD